MNHIASQSFLCRKIGEVHKNTQARNQRGSLGADELPLSRECIVANWLQSISRALHSVTKPGSQCDAGASVASGVILWTSPVASVSIACSYWRWNRNKLYSRAFASVQPIKLSKIILNSRRTRRWRQRHIVNQVCNLGFSCSLSAAAFWLQAVAPDHCHGLSQITATVWARSPQNIFRFRTSESQNITPLWKSWLYGPDTYYIHCTKRSQ